MKALSLNPKIIALARALNLPADDAVQSILSHCKSRVARMLKAASGIHTIWDLERVVCGHLNLAIHEIWNDEELRAFSLKYASDEGDSKFAALDMELEQPDTFGVLYQRDRRNAAGEFRYVAFVDCRSDKALRRFFTRWHEIAHCLTTVQQFEFPFRRTNLVDIEKDPVEKMMDMIAGGLGFSEPLFRPILDQVAGGRKLTFDTVEVVRQQFCPDASFQATLNACVTHVATPVVLLEIGLGLKKEQQRALHDPQLQFLPTPVPKPCLRVLRSMPNAASREISLQVHKNWRVPGYSIIAKVFNSDANNRDGQSVENLSSWKSSDGSSLADLDVLIQARKVQDKVYALVCPFR
ncbi:MAG: hypothetical protein ACLQU3_26070 [Limisphaerales bacterium]